MRTTSFMLPTTRLQVVAPQSTQTTHLASLVTQPTQMTHWAPYEHCVALVVIPASLTSRLAAVDPSRPQRWTALSPLSTLKRVVMRL